jgi:cell shape-determining protein MreC
MKMSYRLTRSTSRLGYFKSGTVPLLFVAALLLFLWRYPTALADLAMRVTTPLWRAETRVADLFHALMLSARSKQALIAERERLVRELSDARALLHDRELLRDENQAFARQIGRAERGVKRIVGAALSLPPRSPYDTAIIDVGRTDGVAKGDIAFSGSAALGVVSEVYSHASRIEFFSTAGRKTPVVIAHKGAAVPVEAVGQGGGAFLAVLPKAVEIWVGDAVALFGIASGFFATVDSVESSATDSYQRVRFKNPVSLYTLRFVEIAHSVSAE